MATPSLAMIPSAYADSKLYSVLPNNGDGDFTFDRASTATRIGQNGLIETVLTDQPRLNYDISNGVVQSCPSLLLEPASTNLITYSEDFSNAYWVKNNSAVTSGFVSPEGTTSAYKLIEDTSNTTHKLWAQETTLAATYSFSLFAKAGERRRIGLRDNQVGNNAIFDLISGTVVSGSGSIVALTNGYYRISLTGTYAAAGTRHEIYILEDSATSITAAYQGDGTSGVYIWGAQLEEQSYATSYIPNFGQSAGVTRAAETCFGAGNAATFNSTEGVLYLDIATLVDSTNGGVRRFSLSDGTDNNRIQLVFTNTTGRISVIVKAGGLFQIDDEFSGYNTTESNKIAIRYGSGLFKVYINGLSVFSDAGVAFSSISLDDLSFANTSGSEPMYSRCKDLRVYNEALTDAQLQTLTT